jgi:glutamine synthetase
VDALQVLIRSETVSLFETHKVLTKEEMESRYHIYLEKYSKQVNIEAGVTIDLARRYIFPVVSSYAASLAQDAAALAGIGANNTAQSKRAKRIADLAAELFDETARLETALAEAQGIEDAFAQAKAYCEKIRPCMDAVRSRGDALEKIVAKDAWPFPGYEELLFKL